MTPETGKCTAAVFAAAYDVSMWLEVRGFDGLTNEQRALLVDMRPEAVADCDGMLDDLEARVGVDESLLMKLRWAVHDLRALTGKDAF